MILAIKIVDFGFEKKQENENELNYFEKINVKENDGENYEREVFFVDSLDKLKSNFLEFTFIQEDDFIFDYKLFKNGEQEEIKININGALTEMIYEDNVIVEMIYDGEKLEKNNWRLHYVLIEKSLKLCNPVFAKKAVEIYNEKKAIGEENSKKGVLKKYEFFNETENATGPIKFYILENGKNIFVKYATAKGSLEILNFVER